jgi:predicted nucleotidyltransferase component of viral defense system
LVDPPAGLVFKGGTALRLYYYDRFRYSADLDFSLLNLAKSDALDAFGRALSRAVDEIGFPELTLGQDESVIRYVGPLGRRREIKLDLAEDELVIETTRRNLIVRYADQEDDLSTVSLYTLEEIAAEKKRCVIQRLICRDLSDLHRLVVIEAVDVKTTWPMFEEKARAKGIDPGVFAERFSARQEQYRRRWANELAEFEPDAVPYEQVERQLRRALRDHL